MHSGFVTAGGHRLEYQLIPAHQINRPTLVLLHEGLGSVAMWRDFPARLASATVRSDSPRRARRISLR